MAQIGCFGELVFQTSDQMILTPQRIKQKIGSQWGKHKIIGRKPKGEFNGPDAREISFTITLDVLYGVKPRSLMEKIEDMIENGFTDYLVIGNKAVGKHKFAITGMSETWEVVYSRGELAKATLDITLEEYE